MTPERLETLIEAYGADPGRWPEAERAAAEAALATTPALNALLQDARELDALLNGAPQPEPSASLRRAVAEIPLRHPRATGLRAWWPFQSFFRPAMAGACVLLLGVWTGSTVSVGSPSLVAEVELQAQAMDDDWEDLSALAFAAAPHLDDLEEEGSP